MSLMDALKMNGNKSKSSFLSLSLVTIAVGVGSGVLGTFLVFLLHYIQHIAYGYSLDLVISDETFLAGVSAASSQRRVLILVLCGFIAGFGWAALYRYGKPLVSISQALTTNKTMPVFATTLHALLQIITIALGSPLGREVAPREVGALFATWVSTKAQLHATEIKTMLACGAGAGLAAVYNVPFAGAIFILEVLLCSYNWALVLPALTSCAIAVSISWLVLGNEPLYQIPLLTLDYSLVIWSIVCGPVFGFLAFWFIQIATHQKNNASRGWPMIGLCLFNFTCIGGLAVYFPELLGNGKSPTQMQFANAVGIGLSTILLILRCVITWSSLRVGAQGGLLTPSLANGALLGVILGRLWCFSLGSSASFEAFAIIGAAAFLAAAQKMPLTAIVLVFEMTRLPLSFFIPVMFAVSGSFGVFYLLNKRFK